ncbi:MAG TPA: ABC transporter substrate-binding protein [Flavobacteriaceae bacterium]|nr:ABC transporter substrate-binding protein [Flavobacteriaceae bacterium]
MKKIRYAISFLFMALVFSACKNETNSEEAKSAKESSETTTQRIVSLNGAVTAIIADLGHGKELVGRDMTSTYPEWVQDSIKNLGHLRSLSLEALMSLHPSVVLALEEDISPDLKKSLENSGIRYKLFEREFSVEGTKSLIKDVAEFIGASPEKVKPMLQKIDADLSKIESFEKKPKVLFIYARGAGTLMVAGDGTSMGNIIEIAGAENAGEALNNFKPLTTEALLNINPDVIFLFKSGLESLDEAGGILNIPGVSQTTAGKNKAIITMEGGLVSNFGPRLGEAAYRLNQLLIPYAK